MKVCFCGVEVQWMLKVDQWLLALASSQVTNIIYSLITVTFSLLLFFHIRWALSYRCVYCSGDNDSFASVEFLLFRCVGANDVLIYACVCYPGVLMLMMCWFMPYGSVIQVCWWYFHLPSSLHYFSTFRTLLWLP